MSRITIAVAVFLALSLTAVIPAWGQQGMNVSQLNFTALLPAQTGTVNAAVPPGGGTVTLYYWVVTRYPIGATQPKGPAAAYRTLGVANLAMGPVVLTWQAMPGATGYDVIRGTTPALLTPANACVNCVVSSNQAGTTFTDAGGGVVNWPTAGTVMAASKILTLAINNRDDSYPFLQSNGELHIVPTRSTNDYAYLYQIQGLMTGGAAQKTYGLGILVNRPTTAVATGDSNDAIFGGTYSNYAKNDANFIIRGVNTTTSNGSPGTLGMVEGGLISAANRSGGTAPIVSGLFIGVENFGVTANQFSGATVSLKNEGAKATLEYGIKVQNDNNSLGTAADAAYMIRSSAGLTNTGFQYGMDMNGATIGTADLRTSAGNNIYSGNGAPAAGLCAAPTLGSIYLRTAGGAGTSLYVCEVAGAWAGK